MIVVEIPEFVHRIKISSRQKTKYFDKSKKKAVPKKYQDSSLYCYQPYTIRGTKKLLLTCRKTGKRVVANPIAKDNARYLVIGANLIYAGVHHSVRTKVVDAIKKCFYPYIKNLPSLNHPVQIHAELHMPYKLPNTNDGSWDVGNMMFFYGKVFEDMLTEYKKYPDDNVYHVTHSATGGLFVPVETYEERKLVYRIMEDKRIELKPKL